MYTISATELARNTRKILDAVAGRGETVVVERNHVLIARIVPSESTMTAAQALAGLQPMLTPSQAAAWLADSRSEFDDAVRDPWG
jgi:antitoxin (DNA-binding transcriptional repressor) of toxin-antitoxin stability system